jgi:predicted DNA-binding WGR domain protein
VRRFVYSQGTSNKFWEVAVAGSELTVTWGRIGTAGQTKTKALAGEDAARAAAAKLIAEKIGKGYTEEAVAGDAALPAAEPAPPAPAPPSEPTPPPVAPSAPTPQAAAPRPPIDLPAYQWAWAAWRPLPPPPGLPRPFDPAACAATIRAGARSESYGWTWGWSIAPFTGPITAAEAAAWLELVRQDVRSTPTETAKAMAARDPGAVLSFEEGRELALRSDLPYGLTMAALVALGGAEPVAEWLLAPTSVIAYQPQHYGLGPTHDPRLDLVGGARAFLLPALDEDALRELTDTVRGRLATAVWPPIAQSYDQPDIAFFLAAQLGLHDELQHVVDSMPDRAYRPADFADYYHRVQAIAFGLGSPAAVHAAFERLGLVFRSSWHVAGWLACTELTGLDLAADRIASITNRDEAAAMLRTLANVHDAAAAPVMLDLMRSSKAPGVARQWLADHPLEAQLGAARALGTGDRSRSAAALDFLRTRKRAGDDVTLALPHLDAAEQQRLRELVLDHADEAGTELARTELPADLRAALDAVGRRKLPPWLDVQALPPLRIGEGGYLGEAEVQDVLRACAAAKSSDERPQAPAILAEHADQASCEAFGWALFDAWSIAGAPSNAKWAMLALGWFGGDATATRLAPMIRAWPGESQHARAVLGLGVLAAIGTDTALMQLSGIAQKVKFKALQTRAREAMDAIAAAKGMTKAELEDRIVPDCGLDERGSRSFDFGPRSFSFVLGPGMKPMVRDENGKARPSLPKPGARDDAALAARAADEWKLLRKQVADLAKVQAARLEQAMVTQRRWTVADFERFLVRHPLQRHLTRLLVWGTWRDGVLRDTFRVTDELDYADAGDDVFALPGDDARLEVGIVHPLQLDGATRAAWGETLADYEIVPPFAQLGRPVHRLAPDDERQRELTRFKDRKVAAAALVRILENLGWQRGAAFDAGIFTLHAKAFPALGVTAVVEYEGVPMGYMVDWEDQSIERCYVVDGVRSAHDFGWGAGDRRGTKPLPWGSVDPIVCSEVLADVASILEKAR